MIYNVTWRDRISNSNILERCGIASIESFVTRAQLRWAGHVVRMGPERIPKALMFGKLHPGKRNQGGQRKRYKDVLNTWLKSYGTDLHPSRTSQITSLYCAPLATMASRCSRQHELLGSAGSVGVAMLEILARIPHLIANLSAAIVSVFAPRALG